MIIFNDGWHRPILMALMPAETQRLSADPSCMTYHLRYDAHRLITAIRAEGQRMTSPERQLLETLLISPFLMPSDDADKWWVESFSSTWFLHIERPDLMCFFALGATPRRTWDGKGLRQCGLREPASTKASIFLSSHWDERGIDDESLLIATLMRERLLLTMIPTLSMIYENNRRMHMMRKFLI